MKLIPPLHSELVSIIFQPHQLTLSQIQASHKKVQLDLCAYQQISLNDLELEKLIIYNPTRIKNYISTFLTKHKIKNAFVLFALSGFGLFERYVALSTPNAQPKDFKISELQQLNWEYTYVYPTDNAQSMYYVCGLPNKLLLQYQLLAITTRLNLLKITTKRMALHSIYKYMYGTAFRRSQLAIDMLRHNNMIEYLFSQDTLSRVVHIPTRIDVDKKMEIMNILSACGLITSDENLVASH